MCFSLVSRTSFENVSSKWWPELEQYAKGTPVVLVGTKVDLRNDSNFVAQMAQKDQKPITTAEGQALAKSLGAAAYCECSAKTQEGLKEVFDKAIGVVLNPTPEPKKKKKCVLL